MPKRKRKKGKTTIYKTYLYSKRSSYRSPTKERCELDNFIGQYLNLPGLELKDMLIQQELIFIEMDRTNIPERTRSFILNEIKFEQRPVIIY
jgi:hypothetical protein